jgi:hypothetical protein
MLDEPALITDEQVERLADLVATKLTVMRSQTIAMLTVEDVADTFRVSRAWVYENARRLGGVKLGPGERAPLRFDPAIVAAALRPAGEVADTTVAAPAKNARPRRSRQRLHPVDDV